MNFIRLSLISVLLLSCFTIQAQVPKFSAGLTGGPSLTFLWGNSVLTTDMARSAFSSGAFFQFNTAGKISIRTELAFERKGIGGTGLVQIPPGNLYEEASFNFNFDYICLPILARWSFGQNRTFFVNLGPYVGFLLRHQVVTRTESLPRTADNNSSFYNDLDVGISTGLGYRIPVGDNFAASIEGRSNLGIINISSLPVINGNQISTYSASLLLGFAYLFGG